VWFYLVDAVRKKQNQTILFTSVALWLVGVVLGEYAGRMPTSLLAKPKEYADWIPRW